MGSGAFFGMDSFSSCNSPRVSRKFVSPTVSAWQKLLVLIGLSYVIGASIEVWIVAILCEDFPIPSF